MVYVRNFLRFWYDFIVGDDWVIAVGIAATMVAAWLLEESSFPSWWLFVLAIVGLLFVTVKRAARD